MSETFDIREFLADRAYPSATQRALLSEELAFELAAIRDEHASNTDAKEQKRLDAKLEEVERRVDEAKFTFHLRAISRRAKEDIQSAALAEVPILRDMYGRDEPKREIDRRRVLTEMIFAQHITKMVSPTGAEQVWTEDNRRDLARAILDGAPDSTITLLDRAIGRLSGDAEMDRAQHLDPNS